MARPPDGRTTVRCPGERAADDDVPFGTPQPWGNGCRSGVSFGAVPDAADRRMWARIGRPNGRCYCAYRACPRVRRLVAIAGHSTATTVSGIFFLLLPR